MTKRNNSLPAGPYMYLGPTLSRGRLNNKAVFREGKVPPYLADLFEKYPEEFELLFAPVSDIRSTEEKIQMLGSPEQIAYESISKGV